MNIVILDAFAVNPGDMNWDFLKKYGSLEVYDSTAPEMYASRASNADILLVNRAVLGREVLRECGKLKLICTLGTGYDMIDLSYCREHGIGVSNVPAYSSASVAQLAFTLLLGLVTDVEGLRNIVRGGNWTGISGFAYQKVKYTELEGMTLGLLGCGNIGRRVAVMAQAFGMKTAASTKTHTSGSNGDIRYLPLDEMLAQSDILSIHCPLNSETRGMVDRDFIGKMKDGAYLINTARGAILNEADTAQALRSGKLAGAGLDVLAVEPALSSNPLLGAPNTIITPHVGWTTLAARTRLLQTIDLNISSCISGSITNSVL